MALIAGYSSIIHQYTSTAWKYSVRHSSRHTWLSVPISFWWLSLIGSVLLLTYGLQQRDSVFIFAYAFTWIPYIRSIGIHNRNHALKAHCISCGTHAWRHAVLANGAVAFLCQYHAFEESLVAVR